MAYQNGSLRKTRWKEGLIWQYGYLVSKNGKRVENVKRVGLVADLPTESDAWRMVDELGYRGLANSTRDSSSRRITFAELAQLYLSKELQGKKKTTRKGVTCYVKNHLIPQWGRYLAGDIKRREVRDWLDSLNTNKGGNFEGPTVSKMKGVMSMIFGFGIFEELVESNPCSGWRLKDVKSKHKSVTVTPAQAMATVRLLVTPMFRVLVYLVACTALRASEACGLRWRDLGGDHIKIQRRWSASDLDDPKTRASEAAVPMHPVLASLLRTWRSTTPYGGDDDWIFPSLKMGGRIPMCPGIFVTDHLRPAALRAGIRIDPRQRLGLHSFRASLATWLVSVDKCDPKTAQGILRHATVEITLDLYAQTVSQEAIAAQGRYLEALGQNLGQALLPETSASAVESGAVGA